MRKLNDLLNSFTNFVESQEEHLKELSKLKT